MKWESLTRIEADGTRFWKELHQFVRRAPADEEFDNLRCDFGKWRRKVERSKKFEKLLLKRKISNQPGPGTSRPGPKGPGSAACPECGPPIGPVGRLLMPIRGMLFYHSKGRRERSRRLGSYPYPWWNGNPGTSYPAQGGTARRRPGANYTRTPALNGFVQFDETFLDPIKEIVWSRVWTQVEEEFGSRAAEIREKADARFSFMPIREAAAADRRRWAKLAGRASISACTRR